MNGKFLVVKNWCETEIENLAGNLRKKYAEKTRQAATDNVDALDLTLRLGGRVDYVPFIDYGVETLIIDDTTHKNTSGRWGNNGFRIRVEKDTPTRHQNLKIARELGHFFLHFLNNNGRDRVFRRVSYAEDDRQREATRFALALLMPKEEYITQYNGNNGDLLKVADIFDVPIVAAEMRAKILGLR